MGLPKKLVNFNLFGDGNSFVGQGTEVQLPKLSRKMDTYNGGGLIGEIETDNGLEVITLEHTYGGIMREILRQFGLQRHDGAMLRFAGAYRAEDSDQVDAVEVVVRGRHKEIDPGTAKKGDATAFKVVTTCTYYKLTINGETVIEIDVLAGIEIYDGVDRQADVRTAIGL